VKPGSIIVFLLTLSALSAIIAVLQEPLEMVKSTNQLIYYCLGFTIFGIAVALPFRVVWLWNRMKK